jgi:hypothetical protein
MPLVPLAPPPWRSCAVSGSWIVGADAAKREISWQVKPYACLGGNRSVVKRNRGIDGFTGLSYCEGTAHRLLAFLELVGVARR